MISFKKTTRRLMAAGALTALAAAPALAPSQAEEFRIDRLFVLGDSLSDSGAFSQSVIAGSGGTVPNINYKFLTNAPDGSSRVWAEGLADQLGINLGPDVLEGVPAAGGLFPTVDVNGGNYAQGGSRVSQQPGIANNAANGITTIPVTEQVDRILADNPTFDEKDLIAVWAGANDVFFQAGLVGGGAINAATAGANMVQAATELAEQIDRLKAAGATNIIAITLPDIGTTPAAIAGGPASQALQSGLSDAFNTQLLTSLRGKDVVIVDAAKLLNGVAANPARYGFTAPNAATVPGCTVISSLTCIQGVNTLPDSEQRIYADGVHPTTAAHALFAQAGFAGLQAATQNGTMAVSILTAIRQQALSLENRLNPTALVTTSDAGDTVRRRIGHIEWYGGPEVGYYEADAEQVRPGLSAVTQVVKFGADVMVTNNALVGLAGSIDHGQVKFDGDKGHFDSRLFIGGAFGMVALPRGVYLNAAAAVGLIDIYDIERSFMLGPAEESYESDTDGLYTMIRGGGGVMLPVTETVIFNPSASFTYERVEIDGYTEEDGIASLAFGDTEYEVGRISVGGTLIFSNDDPTGFRGTLRASLEHDVFDDTIDVQMGPDQANLATVSAPRPDRTYGFLQAQLVKPVFGDGAVTLATSAVIGYEGLTGLTGSLSFRKGF